MNASYPTFSIPHCVLLLVFGTASVHLMSCSEPPPDLRTEDSTLLYLLAVRDIEDIDARMENVREGWPTGGRYEWSGNLDSSWVADGYIMWTVEVLFSPVTSSTLYYYTGPSGKVVEGFAVKYYPFGREGESRYLRGYRDEGVVSSRRRSIYERLSVEPPADTKIDSILDLYQIEYSQSAFSYGCGYVQETPELRNRLQEELRSGNYDVPRALLVSFDPQLQLYGLEAWLATTQGRIPLTESADLIRELLGPTEIWGCSGCIVWSESAEEFAKSVLGERSWVTGYGLR